MAFNHGITATESPTKLIAAVSDSITPVYVGTAPINLCKERNIMSLFYVALMQKQ